MSTGKKRKRWFGNRTRRRGQIIVISGLLLVALIGILACALDIGYIVMTKAQLHAATDAAALAGGTELLPGLGKYATKTPEEIDPLVRAQAVAYAAANRAGDRASVYIDSDRDVTLGKARRNTETGVWEFEWGATPYNAVRVIARRDQVDQSAGDARLPLFFARIFGIQTQRLAVLSTAVIMPADSFTVTPGEGEVPLLPFAMELGLWKHYLRAQYHFEHTLGSDPDLIVYNSDSQQDPKSFEDDGKGDPDDDADDDSSAAGRLLYFIEEMQGNKLVPVQIIDDAMQINEDGNVIAGKDGKLEFSIYPILATSGNMGTIDLGSTSNSTADIVRQILTGVSPADFSYFPNNTIEATPEDPLTVEGDTGVSAGFENAIEERLGESRAVAIYDTVSQPGNNAAFEVVFFRGIRMMSIDLSGNNKSFVVQESMLSTPGGVPGDEEPGDDTTVLTPLILAQ